MNENENIGVFAALWRFVTFYKVRKALGLARAADRQFTGSPQGIGDAFEIQRNKLVKEYNGLRDAVAEVEGVIETDKNRLDMLNKEEEDLITKREGALAKFEAAQTANNTADMAAHKAAFDRFDKRIHEIEAEQATLDARIKETGKTMEGYLRQLTTMQSEIQQMPAEKARAIADFVSATKIVELNDRLNGIKTSLERGPIDAVLEQNRQLTAKARITQKLAGTDVAAQDDAYKTAGQSVTSGDRMQQMLAERAAKRTAKTGAAPETAPKPPERPVI